MSLLKMKHVQHAIQSQHSSLLKQNYRNITAFENESGILLFSGATKNSSSEELKLRFITKKDTNAVKNPQDRAKFFQISLSSQKETRKKRTSVSLNLSGALLHGFNHLETHVSRRSFHNMQNLLKIYQRTSPTTNGKIPKVPKFCSCQRNNKYE